jgi:hypothetical protein
MADVQPGEPGTQLSERRGGALVGQHPIIGGFLAHRPSVQFVLPGSASSSPPVACPTHVAGAGVD